MYHPFVMAYRPTLTREVKAAQRSMVRLNNEVRVGQHDLALFMVRLWGSKITYQRGHGEHRAKDDQHCSIRVPKVRV